MPTITNPSVLPSGTVGVPYSVTFNIDKQGDVSYPYVLQLQTAGTLPPGLENNLKAAKNVDQDGSLAGTPQDGETIVGQTSGAQGVYIRLGSGANIGMQYVPINNFSFSIGEQVDGEITGPLGLIDSAITNSLTYGARLLLLPTLVPAAPFDDFNWTVSGTPTTAGTYNFQLRMFNGDEQLFTGFNFQITINAPVIPSTRPRRRRTGFGIPSDTLCFNRNYIEKAFPGSCRPGGIISAYRVSYEFSHADANGNCCFKKITS